MAMKKDACSLEKSYDQPRQYIKKQRHYFANKGPSSQNNVKVKDLYSGDFPGGSVVKTLCFHCRGHGFDPWWGDLKILCGIAKKIFFNSVCLFQTYGVTSTTNRPQLTYFIFLGFKITADSDCSHEIKRPLLLRRKAMTNLDSVLKTETFLC